MYDQCYLHIEINQLSYPREMGTPLQNSFKKDHGGISLSSQYQNSKLLNKKKESKQRHDFKAPSKKYSKYYFLNLIYKFTFELC